jgi:hypothetical protein
MKRFGLLFEMRGIERTRKMVELLCACMYRIGVSPVIRVPGAVFEEVLKGLVLVLGIVEIREERGEDEMWNRFCR